MINIESEQKLFESWVSDPIDPIRAEKLPLDKHPNGAYKDQRTYIAFYTWKAKAKTVLNLQEENAVLKKGIAAVRSLMNESDGASGLHLNGDMADWESLCEGGRFEGWLIDFNKAENTL